MKRLILMALATALAALSLPAVAGHGDDDSSDDRPTVCERTAKKMYKSCRFEVNEELYATTAKCINFGDRDERNTCKEVARETYWEDREGCGEQREAREEVCELLGENRFDPEALLDTGNFVAGS